MVLLCLTFFHYGSHFLVFENDQDLNLILYLVDKTVGNLIGSFTQFGGKATW